jgi:hypothetical protein
MHASEQYKVKHGVAYSKNGPIFSGWRKMREDDAQIRNIILTNVRRNRRKAKKWYLQTWAICLKSDRAFISPRLSTLAVMKKHSQINEKFSFFENLDRDPPLERREAVPFLPELVASCDPTKQSSLVVVFWACSLFMLSIKDETSSEEAFIAVKSLQLQCIC